jgi:flagellar biosynthesis chaperone FliJ
MARRFEFRLQRVLERREKQLRVARGELAETIRQLESAAASLQRARRQAQDCRAYLRNQEASSAHSNGDWRLTLQNAAVTAARAEEAIIPAEQIWLRAEAAAGEARRKVEDAVRLVSQLEAYRDHLRRQFRRDQEVAEAAELAEVGAAMRALALRTQELSERCEGGAP